MRPLVIYTIILAIIILTQLLQLNNPNKYLPNQELAIEKFILKQHSPTCWYVQNQILFKLDGCGRYELGSQLTLLGTLTEPTDSSLGDLFLLEPSAVKVVIKPSELVWYHPKFIQSRLFQIRDNLHHRLRLILPKQDAELYFSLIFGGTSFLPDETKQAIAYLGIQHIMAASGMQVSLLLLLLLSLEKYFSKKLRFLFRFCYLLLYAELALMSVSIVRAVFQSLFSTLFLVKHRQSSYSWSLLLFLLLFLTTEISDSRVALQLTILAVLGLQFRQFLERLNHSQVGHKNIKQTIQNKAIKYIKEVLITTIWVQVWLFPFLSFYFMQVSSMSLVATLAISWLLAPLFVLGIILVSVISFLPFSVIQSMPVLLASSPLYFGTWLLRFLIRLMESIELPPISINFSITALIGWYLCLTLLFWWLDARWFAKIHSDDLKIIRKKY